MRCAQRGRDRVGNELELVWQYSGPGNVSRYLGLGLRFRDREQASRPTEILRGAFH